MRMAFKQQTIIIAVLLAMCLTPSFASAANTLNTIISDMTDPPDTKPHGVPADYDWAQGPTTRHIEDVPTETIRRFHAVTAWGQVYIPVTGNPARNTRVQVRNLKTYVLRKPDMTWHLIQHGPIVGAAYKENFSMGVNIPADIRREPSGGISVMLIKGFNFHFYHEHRAPFNPNTDAGFFITAEARLIPNDPAQPLDMKQARLIMNVGADVYENYEDTPTYAPEIGVGRFKYVTPAWQSFNMTTLKPSQIRQYPPPVNR